MEKMNLSEARVFHFVSEGLHLIGYPKDIEIYIKPLSIKEQIDMERYGISDAEYFQMILNGITIHGDFNKRNLLHSDIQFIDVVRRLFSFDVKDSEIKYLISSTLTYNKNGYINNHYDECYLITKDIDISKLKLQESEVSEIKYLVGVNSITKLILPPSAACPFSTKLNIIPFITFCILYKPADG